MYNVQLLNPFWSFFLWGGSQVPPPPPQVMGEDSYGGAGGKVLWITLLRVESHGTGGPSVAHHLQCGGGHIFPTLGVPDGGRIWRWQQGKHQRRLSGTAGNTDNQGAQQRKTVEGGRAYMAEGAGSVFIRRRQDVSLQKPRVVTDRVLHAGDTIWRGRFEYVCPQNSGDCMPYIPVSWGTGRLSLYPAYDGVREELQGESEVAGHLQWVQ